MKRHMFGILVGPITHRESRVGKNTLTIKVGLGVEPILEE